MSRILVVDDDRDLRFVVISGLRRRGHDVEEAESGAEALRKATVGVFDAAVVDYQMPPPDGLELLSHLRQMQPRCVRLLMSGSLAPRVLMDAVNRGEVARVIEKPFETAPFVAIVEETIAARARQQDLYVEAMQEGFAAQRRFLEECLTGNLLRLALQPIVSATDTCVQGYEALLRSSHAVLSTAIRVIAAAEIQDMLDRLADRVACCVRSHLETLPEHTNLFVNVHPRELTDVDRVRRRFEPLRPWSDRIVLEITERSHVMQIMHWREAVNYLTGAGFRIAVDDLGAGYNSLSVLAELQPAFAKVDMSIVRHIDRDERKQRLVELLSRFAHATGAQLIVEGIETEPEAQVVRRLGADLLQGYLFGRPTDAPLTTTPSGHR